MQDFVHQPYDYCIMTNAETLISNYEGMLLQMLPRSPAM